MSSSSITIARAGHPKLDPIISQEALEFIADLQRTFGPRRDALLARRRERRAEVARTGRLDFLPDTADIREDSTWTVGPAPADLLDRRVEITGPTDAKLVINALNSGAKTFMADFEDATTPTWTNLLQGQASLIEAIDRTISFTSPDGREYRLDPDPAVLLVRPRGWHLDEEHAIVDGEAMSGSIFDFGLYMFHNARRLVEQGSGPYFYLPKLESHLEARLWNDVFVAAQYALGLPRGTIRATVLIETIPAAFEMEEILFELREHASGLNAGRWDYMFSIIKTFRDCGPEFVLPDRNSVTMTAPFMRAYTELLVATCHRRGAFAMGGMAAFVPSRRDPEAEAAAIARVREDKTREAGDGFDGTWVAHPDLVPVAMEVFDGVLGDRPNQLERQRPDVRVSSRDLLNVSATAGRATVEGLRNDITVCLRYVESWLRGRGAVAIFNLMEDAATAEIARSQVWQWLHSGTVLETGEQVTVELVRKVADEELAGIREELGAAEYGSSRYHDAHKLFQQIAIDDEFVDFLTVPALALVQDR